MNIDNLFPSKYVRAADLGGKHVTLTIVKAEMVEMGHGSERETKLVISFAKATKGLVCNRTIAMSIAKMYGKNTDDWLQQRITIYPTTVRAFGATHEVIRVKEQVPPAPTPATQAAQEEAAAEMDDQEDIVDAEGHEESGDDDDPAAIWDDGKLPDESPATIRPKQALLSVAQLARINTLGASCYGQERWQSVEEVRWAENVSTGNVKTVDQLLPEEGDVLIAKLEKRLQTRQAAQVQSTGEAKPVADGVAA